MNKIISLLAHPRTMINKLFTHCGRGISDRIYLRYIYLINFGKIPNLDNPQTFNEKMNWLKLHDRKDIYTTMADKYSVKEFVAKRIGAEYVVKNGQDEILRLTTAKSEDSTVLIEKLRSSTAISVVPQEAWQTPAKSLFYKLSATHLIYLSNFDNDLKRAFYEQEAIRGCWTVTELDRQVSSQYYERMGLSKDKKALQKLAVNNVYLFSYFLTF